MTASVAFIEDYELGEELMLRYRQAVGWSPGAGDEGLHGFLCSLEHDDCAHGERWQYRSPNTDMLGWVCERAAGVSFAEALSERLWTPIGAEGDADVLVDRYGAARAAGGLATTARDLARVGQLLADGGRDVLPDWFIDDLFHGGDPELWAAGNLAEYLPSGSAYRSCWYEYANEPDLLGAVGIHGQMIYIDQPRRVVVAKQSHWPEADTDASLPAMRPAAAAIAHALAG
jgi:CubicO group peptidase (beta-lactamase class C family)